MDRRPHRRLWYGFACGLALIVLTIGTTVQPAPQDILLTPQAARTVSTAPVERPKKPTNAVLCLAQTLFYEANTEPDIAIQAVAATVFNRMSSPHYPRTVCGVVYQYRQYSWTLDTRRWSRRPPKTFMQMAKDFLDRRDELQTLFSVTHFHHEDILPSWAPSLTYVGQFGQHRFYVM